MTRLLVVHHSPTRSTAALAAAALAGSRDDAIEGVEVLERPALEATAEDVLGSDAVLLGTPANFGYMSGALKHFFDTVFLDVGGALGDDGSAGGGSAGGGSAGGGPGGRTPWGLWVHGRYDTAGAVRAVGSIVGALPWTQAAPVLEVLGDVGPEHEEQAYELGATLAALVST